MLLFKYKGVIFFWIFGSSKFTVSFGKVFETVSEVFWEFSVSVVFLITILFTGAHEANNINKNKKSVMKTGLYIVSTPIGNLNDISARAINTLNNSDIIICENPKHSLKLLSKLGIKKKLISLHDYNEEVVIENLKEDLSVKKISLISDAGAPLMCDPGYKLVRHCVENLSLIHISEPTRPY